MKKVFISILVCSFITTNLMSDVHKCMNHLKFSYDIGLGSMGGYFNYEHAKTICEKQIGFFDVLNGYPGTFEACMMGIDRNLANKDLLSLYLKYCSK